MPATYSNSRRRSNPASPRPGRHRPAGQNTHAMKKLFPLIAVLATLCATAAQRPLQLIPQPVRAELREGLFAARGCKVTAEGFASRPEGLIRVPRHWPPHTESSRPGKRGTRSSCNWTPARHPPPKDTGSASPNTRQNSRRAMKAASSTDSRRSCKWPTPTVTSPVPRSRTTPATATGDSTWTSAATFSPWSS